MTKKCWLDFTNLELKPHHSRFGPLLFLVQNLLNSMKKCVFLENHAISCNVFSIIKNAFITKLAVLSSFLDFFSYWTISILKSDFDGVKRKVGLWLITKYTKPNLLNQIYLTKSKSYLLSKMFEMLITNYTKTTILSQI